MAVNIPAKENQHIEFKREEVSSQVLTEEIVAFANGEGEKYGWVSTITGVQ